MRLIDAKNLGIDVKTTRKVLVISPFSRKTKDNKRSPKDYPHWRELVKIAKSKGYYVIQVGVSGEDTIGADDIKLNKELEYLEKLIKKTDKWISVDNFFHHLAWSVNKSGIVIWGPSDYKIFGHDLHLNIIKDRKYLRKRQFGEWNEIEYDPSIFPSAKYVAEEL